MKKLLIFIVVIVVVVVIWFFWPRPFEQGQFTLVNQADWAISKAIVQVCGQKFELKELKPGETRVMCFVQRPESEYRIDIEFTTGSKLTTEAGYVGSGMIVDDTFIIKNDEIILKCNTKLKW